MSKFLRDNGAMRSMMAKDSFYRNYYKKIVKVILNLTWIINWKINVILRNFVTILLLVIF